MRILANTSLKILVLWSLWLNLGGCMLPSRQYQQPRTLGQQRLEATQWDPYAEVDNAPEIVGGRPREFQRPAAEPVRAKGFRDTRWPF